MSTWLNAGVLATQVAEWAGHSVNVLLRAGHGVAGQLRFGSGRLRDWLACFPDNGRMPGMRSRVMVGRDAELAELGELAERAATAGGRGSLALILGEAGVGKSRLASEFASAMRARGALVISGHGVELEAGELPYAVLADTLRDLVRQIGLDETRRYLGNRAGDLSALLPSLGAGGAWDRAQILSAGVTLLDAIAADRPLYWIVEDLQWADSASRDLLALAARSLGDRSMMLVATVRSGATSGLGPPPNVVALQALPTATTIWLPRLDDRSVLEQLKALRGMAMSRALADRVVSLSDGLPFFVELLATDSDATAGGLAPTVRQLVLARLPRVSTEASELIGVAALGRVPLTLDVMAAVARMGQGELDAAITDAVRGEILEWSRDGEAVVFRHSLMREAVADSIPPPRRRDMHRRWATALLPVNSQDSTATFALAHHWYEAHEAREALAASHEAAARAAAMSEASLEALHLRRCLELWDQVESPDSIVGHDRDVLLYDLFATRWSTEDHLFIQKVAEAELQRAEVQADEISRLWMTMRLERARRSRGEAEDFGSRQIVEERASFLLNAAPDIRIMDCLQENAAVAERFARDLSAVQYERAMAIAQDCPSARARLHTRIFFGIDTVRRGTPGPAIGVLQRMRDEFAGWPVADLWMIEGNLIHCLGEAGRYLDALAVGREAMDRISDPRPLANLYGFIACNTAGALLHLGQWAEADRLLRKAVDIRGSSSPTIDSVMLILSTRRGDLPNPEAALREAQRRVDARPDRLGTDEFLSDLIELLGSRGDMAALHRAVVRLDEIHEEAMPSTVWPGLNAAVRAEAQRDLTDSGPWLHRLDHIADRVQWSSPVGDAYRAEHAAYMARFNGDESPSTWRDAVAAWQAVSRVWEEARCHLDLAKSLLAQRNRYDARVEIVDAFQTADQLGAAPLRADIIAFARRARMPLGASIHSPPLKTDALTVREQEVLEQVAKDRTNDQIASELGISSKTATVHVSRIMTKLQVSSRTEAAAIARGIKLTAPSRQWSEGAIETPASRAKVSLPKERGVRRRHERTLATVLFTDVVGSTEHLVSVGDRAWRERLTAHHRIVRKELDRHGGKEVDTAGDGFFATFPAPGRAVACAQSIIERLRPLGLEIRAGVHTGECETIGDKVGGVAVHIGARVAALAGPSEILVSSTVRDLTVGSDMTFQDAGERELKGLPGRWRLFRVV